MPRQHTTNDPTYRANRARLLANKPGCHWCGAPATEADHLIAFSDGGDHSPDNLVPACKPCNSKRGQRTKARRDKERIAARQAAMNRNTHNNFFTRDASPINPNKLIANQ